MRRKLITYPIVIAVIAFALFIPSRVNAQRLNYKLASVFVYNFIQYIEWPKNKRTGDFVIAVYGSSPITAELNKFITTKHVGEQPIVVKVIKTIDEAKDCQVLFIPLDQSSKLKEIYEALKGKPILIITEKYGLCKKGASISLYLDEDDDYKTKFELNRAVIEGDGLLVSDRLILLATEVK